MSHEVIPVFLFANFLSAVYLFMTDENSDQIRCRVDYSQDTEIKTYGKKTGICISEKVETENIEDSYV